MSETVGEAIDVQGLTLRGCLEAAEDTLSRATRVLGPGRPRAVSRPRQSCLLIVEDEPEAARTIAQYARWAGFADLLYAGTLAEALERLRDATAAVVDYRLPGAAAGPLCATLAHSGVPAVVYTGADPADVESHGLPVIEKPGLDSLRLWLEQAARVPVPCVRAIDLDDAR